MKTKEQAEFKAVAYMRQMRDELSILLQRDPKRFRDELKQSMAEFLARRQKNAANMHLMGEGSGIKIE